MSPKTLVSMLPLVKKNSNTRKRAQQIQSPENHIDMKTTCIPPSHLPREQQSIQVYIYPNRATELVVSLKKFHNASYQEINATKIYVDFSLDR